MTTTKQVATPPNPSGKGGFGDHPENRSNGRWKREDSISYQYNYLLGLSPTKLKNFRTHTIAQRIALQRVKMAITENGLFDTKEITDRTEGKAPQSMDITSAGDKIEPIVIYRPEKLDDTQTK